MTEKLTAYDSAEDLTSDEAIAGFMADAFETNDAAYIAHAFNVAVRAQKIHAAPSVQLVEGLLIEQMITEGANITLRTALEIAKQLEIKLTVKPLAAGLAQT